VANRFEAERGFVSKLQPDADAFYQNFFGDHDRFAVEHVSDGTLERQLDFSGTDQIVKPHASPQTVHVAQRFRRKRDNGPTDFSIRFRSNGATTEHQKLMVNYASDIGHTPGVYAFGIVGDADDFVRFYFLSVDSVVESIRQKSVAVECHRNFVDGEPDGTEALYIPVDDLEEAGAVLARYDGGRGA